MLLMKSYTQSSRHTLAVASHNISSSASHNVSSSRNYERVFTRYAAAMRVMTPACERAEEYL